MVTHLDERIAADTICCLSIVDQQQWDRGVTACMCTPDLPVHTCISANNQS